MDLNINHHTMKPDHLKPSRLLANGMKMGDSHILPNILEAQSLCRCLRADGFSGSMKTLDDDKGFLVIKMIKQRVRKPSHKLNINGLFTIRQTHILSGTVTELCLKITNQKEARMAARDLNYAFPLSKHQVQQAKQLIEQQDEDNG